MEIALLNQDSLKIRSKSATFIVDPVTETSKTEADVAISLMKNPDTSKISDLRLIISGPGEYEIQGVKISGEKSGIYKLSLDKLSVVLASGSTLSKTEGTADADVVIVNADELPGDKAITSMTPTVVVFYGEKGQEAAKTLNENVGAAVNKYSVTFEKLPSEMEVVLLG